MEYITFPWKFDWQTLGEELFDLHAGLSIQFQLKTWSKQRNKKHHFIINFTKTELTSAAKLQRKEVHKMEHVDRIILNSNFINNLNEKIIFTLLTWNFFQLIVQYIRGEKQCERNKKNFYQIFKCLLFICSMKQTFE